MATASELFFVRFSSWLVSGGTMTRRACGKITSFRTSPGFRPIDMAASVWPWLMDWIPARTIWAIKEAV